VSASNLASEWPQRQLVTVAKRIFVGIADARQRGDGGERELPLLNVRDLQDGHVPPAGAIAKRTVPAEADVERYTVRGDDVVITCRGTQLKVASITPSSEGALISANLIAIRAGAELLPAVLLVFLQSPAGQKALLQRGRSSTSSLSLTPRSVGELSIPVPPLAVQQQIAELVGAAEQNYVAGIRAAEQRRAVARAVAVGLLQGSAPFEREERT
jgi:restriction endonuclease S subunit